MPYGAVTVLALNVTAVCANALPVITAPAASEINVLLNIFPLKSAAAARVAWPETCQKMFLACAPPIKVTMAPPPR